jgi:hypothetical protein
MDCLTDAFHKEQKEYYLHTAQWMNVHPQQMLGSPSCIKKYDLHTLSLDELKVCLDSGFCMRHQNLNSKKYYPVSDLC